MVKTMIKIYHAVAIAIILLSIGILVYKVICNQETAIEQRALENEKLDTIISIIDEYEFIEETQEGQE